MKTPEEARNERVRILRGLISIFANAQAFIRILETSQNRGAARQRLSNEFGVDQDIAAIAMTATVESALTSYRLVALKDELAELEAQPGQSGD